MIKLRRKLTNKYLFVLTLIGLTLLLNYVVFLFYFRIMAIHDAYLINISGRQRMLSQRILFLSTKIRMESNSSDVLLTEKELKSAIQLMEKTHQELIRDIASSSYLQRLYFGKQNALDKATREFLFEAKRQWPNSGSLSLDKTNVLLLQLDEATRGFQEENKKHQDIFIAIQTINLIIVLLIIIFSGSFVFRRIIFDFIKKTKLLDEEQKNTKLLLEISVIANESKSIDDAIRETLAKICQYSTWPMGHCYTVSEEDSELLLPAKLWYIEPNKHFSKFIKITEKTTLTKGIGLPGRVLENKEAHWIFDVETDSNFPRNKLAVNLGVHSAFAFPIIVSTRVVSVLEFFSSERITKNTPLLRIVSHVGRQLGQVYEREYSEKERLRINRSLEQRIYDRTKELEELQKIVEINAHQAGMSEVATGLIHNIGNILNSLNIGSETIQKTINNSCYSRLILANEMLKENIDNLPDFLSNDPKGQKLLMYYLKIGDSMGAEFSLLQTEIAEIYKKIQLIKEVITSQQAYATGSKLNEEVIIQDVVDNILTMQCNNLKHYHIQVIKKFDPIEAVNTQKTKLIHILLNLIINAREAMLTTHEANRVLTIEIDDMSEDVSIKISDTGMGISKEHLTKILTYGFTTKKNGHGFGLHFCANALKEMGGKLVVYSDGEGKGAIFTILLPKNKEHI